MLGLYLSSVIVSIGTDIATNIYLKNRLSKNGFVKKENLFDIFMDAPISTKLLMIFSIPILLPLIMFLKYGTFILSIYFALNSIDRVTDEYLIDELKKKGDIVFKYINSDKNIKMKTLNKINSKANSELKEITDSLIIEGIDEKELKKQVSLSKIELSKNSKEIKEKEANEFASTMIDEMLINIDIDNKDKVKLLKELKKIISNNSMTQPNHKTLKYVKKTR